MLFRQLYDLESSTYTYLLADEESREAVLIDPVLENVERDLGLIEDLGLTLRYALDTHVHADHVTALGTLREKSGCRTVLSERAGVGVADLYVKHGDRVKFGRHELEARETPGHTSGCVTYVLGDRSCAFTGDALLIRGSGRTDFQQGDAGALYDSVHEQIFTLPDSTLLYPGHDYRGRTVTSVGEERRLNPRLGGGKTRADFAEIMGRLQLAYPKKIDVAVPANLQLGLKGLPVTAEAEERPRWAPVVRSAAAIPEVPPEWVVGNLGRTRVIDVRETDELSGELGHIAGIEHVPLGTLEVAAREWSRAEPTVVVCRSGGRSGKAALQLEALGFGRVASMRGGMTAWNHARYPVERAPVDAASVPTRGWTIAFATGADAKEEPALASAAALAVACGGKLVTVHATDASEPGGAVVGAETLARFGPSLHHESLVHTCCEDVTDTLLDALRRVKPDLVVCGTHQRGGLSQLLSGSVAESLARNVDVPTLVVPLDGDGLAGRRSGRIGLGRVIVPVGDAESARVGLAAVEWLLRASGGRRPEVVVLEVEGRSALTAQTLPEGVCARREPLRDSLEATIARVAAELQADLIVMATHGHDGVGDALLGSHTERVLRVAPCPLLVVPVGARLGR